MHKEILVMRFLPALLLSFCLALTTSTVPAAEKIAASADEVCPLLIGAKIPKVIFTRVDGTPFDLSAAVSQKPAVLIFYRGGW
ncbi:MAG TPA: hypothetical protein VGK99_10345 [Acidobacteriota bacterium]|jgi:hypothetical protein